MAETFPDHAGGNISLLLHREGSDFPKLSVEIHFLGPFDNYPFARLKSPPILPDPLSDQPRGIPADRSAYFDTKAKALLLPDGDRLHLFRLNLPKLPDKLPAFILAGETVKIPLPALGTMGNGRQA